MAQLNKCPTRDCLTALLTGELSADRQNEIAQHVESCAACQGALESLSPASRSWENLAAGLGSPAHVEPALQQVIAKAKGNAGESKTDADDYPTPGRIGAEPEETQAEPRRTTDDIDLAFLGPPTKEGAIGRVGHYEILAIVGKGGFGTVLKAFDENLHRVVAIKVLSSAYAANGASRKRFIREARTAAVVKNEHVVAIYDVDQDAQPPYLAMEMIDGISLQDKLDKHGPLGVKEVLRIGLQMAEGLAAAHKQGLVHRDIKPANILLENGVERVKITDFGLARAVDDASVTQSGTVAGTPMYMSPEQAEGLPIDSRSDLFSLGSVLYTMCTGHAPFRASGTHAVLKRVIDASPRPIRETNTEIPPWLCDIIGKLHAKSRENRFQTATGVAELLGQRLADLQTGRHIERASHVGGKSEAPALLSPTRTKGLRRRRWYYASAAMLVVLGVAVAVTQLIRYSDPVLPYPRTQLTIFNDNPDMEIEVQGYAHPHHVKQPYKSRGASAHSFGVEPGEWEARGYVDHRLVRRERFTLVSGQWKKIHWNRADDAFTPLFNGKDLTGWTTLFDPKIWRVKDGILEGGGDKGYLVSEREYDDFHFRVEAKFVGKIDSGQWFRFKAGPKNQAYEAQIGGDTGTLLRIDGGGPILLFRNKANSVPADTWFTQEVIAKGNRLSVKLKLNDETVVDTVDDTYRRGHLALQCFSTEGVVYFRKIEIKELPPVYKNDKERLQGRWIAESVEMDGEPQPREITAQITMTFAGNKVNVAPVAKPNSGESTFYLDEQANPKKIDFIDENRKGQFGIYRLEGDRFVLCGGDDDQKDRPTEFRSEGGKNRMLAIFKRAAAVEPGWVQLFNGKDLTGWRVVGNPKNSWQIRDQALWGGGAQTFLLSNQKFANFQIKGEVRVNPGCEMRILTRTNPTDNDLLARTFVPASMRIKQGALANGVSKLEVQLCRNWENEGGPEYTFKRSFKAGEWLRFDLTVRGDRLTADIEIGGTKHELIRTLDPALPVQPCPVIFHLGAKEGSVEFRKIDIKRLPSD